MKAIVQNRYGPPDVLALADIDQPAIGPDDVLVRVDAAGVDRGVWHLMEGLPYLVRLGTGLRGPRKPVRGLDFAGHVAAAGANVTGFRPGDAVYGTADGTFAEYARTTPDRIAPMPANLTAIQAAAVPTSAATALHALRDTGRVRSGQRVLVIGAAGGVGTYAVQLARAYGAGVTGVCSTSKVDLVRSLGADTVIDYTRAEIVDSTRYDLILDIAGNRPVSYLRQALAARGTLVIVGGETPGRWLGGLDRQFRALALSPFVGHRLRTLVSTTRRRDLDALTPFLEAGTVTPAVDRTYPLADVPEAIRYLHAGQARGKVVIVV